MAPDSVEQLRSAIVADTDELRTLKARRDALRKEATEVGRAYKTVETRRARRIKRARERGATTEQLVDDTGLTPQRIRQLAPTRAAKAKAAGGPDVLGAIRAAVEGDQTSPAAAVVRYVAREQLPPEYREGEHVEQLGAARGGKTPAGELVIIEDEAGPLHRTAEQRARVAELAAKPWPATPVIERAQLSGIARAVHELLGETASTLPPAPRVDELLDELDDDERQEHEPERPKSGRPPRKSRGELDASRGIAGIFERSRRALETHGGDMTAAIAELVADAVPDAMRLLDASRAGATYDFTAHPSVPAPLKRPSRKAADMIWEGRPRYVNPSIPNGASVDVLDVNGAYLSALTRTHLPIGRLVEDRPGTPFDRRRSGIYLIEPIVWRHKGMPNPLGDGRDEKGPVWISGATMRLLHRAERLGFGTAPVILESHTSGSSENLLTKFGMILGEARRDALADDDPVTLEYVKAMYSKFVSTAGDSRANADLFRPEWVHEIRSQAYANLWYKAAKVRAAGIPIARMTGTDELHIAATWVDARDEKGQPLFRLGRGLAEMKIKDSYVTGVDRA